MRILVGVDESGAGRAALRWASSIGTRAGAKVEAVRSWTYTPMLLRQLASHEAMDRHTAAELRAVVAEEMGENNEVRKTVVRGPAHYALLTLAKRRQPAMMVVGRRGDERVAPRVLGSVSRRLVAESPCPLVVVSESWAPGWSHDDGPAILVGYDGSDHAERALTWACELARSVSGRLVLAHVAPFTGMDVDDVVVRDKAQGLLEAGAARVTGHGVPCTTELAFGDARQELDRIAEACRVDLVVIGPRGEGPIAKLILGTVATYLTEHADRPVAVVPEGAGSLAGAASS